MDIIKRQRLKFTINSTIIAAVFLFVMFWSFIGIVYVSNRATLNTALEKALETPETYNQYTPQALRCFFIVCIDDGAPSVDGDLSFYGEQQEQLVSTACKVQTGRFKVGKMFFVCKSAPIESGGIRIAVIERTEYRQSMLDTILHIMLLYAVSLGLIALLAFLASARTLLPVAEAFSKQRDLVANASHELKTPLTVISTDLSVIKSEPHTTVEENAKWIESIDAQIVRMQGLIQNMLELSKMESTTPPSEDVDFSIVTEGACLTFEPICFEKNVNLVTTIAENVHVLGDKGALERLIAILLDNAIKYTCVDGKVGVRLQCDQKRAQLSVMNTGETISKEEAEHVFDRFYRTDGARKNEDKNSFGLGLAIAAATVKAHGGTISCKGVDDKGTVFNVTLPLAKKSKKKADKN